MIHTHREIESQQGDGRAPDWCPPNDFCSNERKMIAPYLHARVEQRHDVLGVRINCCDVRAFVTITGETSQRKILGNRLSTVFAALGGGQSRVVAVHHPD
jgi:hypothetical protein